MKYELKELKDLSKVELKVVFKKEEYDVVYEDLLAKAMATAEAPGFRKGKLPRSAYLKRFGDQKVHGDVMESLVNDSYIKIVQEEKIQVVGMPKIDILTDIADDEWGYSATVSVYPEVEVKDYFGIKAVKDTVEVTDEDVESEAKRILSQHSDLEVVTGVALEKGHTAVFDFCGSVDGVEFEGGKAENYSLEIGSGQFIPGFEDQMVGMTEGEEKVLKVKFPEDYMKDLAGKDAEFKVKLHEIKQRVLPELNDSFVKELDIEKVKTVAAWKKFLKGNLEKDRTEAADNKFEDEVFNKLLENNPVIIPDDMINEGIERQVKQLEEQAKRYNIPVDFFLKYQGIESLDKYKELITPSVKNNVQYEVVIGAICKKENVKLTAADYTKYYKKMAGTMSVDEVKEKYPKEAVTEYFKMLKAHDLVLANVVSE